MLALRLLDAPGLGALRRIWPYAAVPGAVALFLPRGGRVAALSVPAGVALVFAGFFLGRLVELAGAVVLTAGLWLAAWLTWRAVRPRAADRATRVLLAVSSGILVVSMPLALAWAAGRAFDLPHPSVGWMVGTHGVLNAVGFALCAVLAWRRLEADPL